MNDTLLYPSSPTCPRFCYIVILENKIRYTYNKYIRKTLDMLDMMGHIIFRGILYE
jgi:hypothetical protein